MDTQAPGKPVWESYPNVDIDEDSRSLYEGLLVKELRVPKCDACGLWFMPHRSICPHCWSFDVTPTPVCGRGRVHLCMILSQGPAAPGVAYPYPVATIELEEQEAVRFTSTIVDCDPKQITIDMPVELQWLDRNGAPFPAFRPRVTAPGGRRMTHNRIKNQIAIAGVGSTGYSRTGTKSARTLAAEAAVLAIRDAGVAREDIGGDYLIGGAGLPCSGAARHG